MKSFTLIFIGFFITACTDVQPGTYDGPGTDIRGKVIDNNTKKPLEGVSIASTFSTSDNGDFYIPKYTLRNIIAFGNGPWGSHRTFIVSKKGYIPMLCVCDMRHASAFAVVLLSPNGTNIERTLKDVGNNVSCIPNDLEKLKG